MRVFVTGHRGYIGVHVVDLLKQHGHDVTGCDLGLFDGCEWAACTEPDRYLRMDVRDLTPDDLSGHDCVIHLAAISNDPMGDLDPGLTESVNLHGSVHVAGNAKIAGVPRFLFAGSCSVYGAGATLDLAEDAPLNPLTPYARSKIEAEKLITAFADSTFSPVFLRNATAFGDSAMLRVDLVANNLLAHAHATSEIKVLSDGTPWRPLIHCRDIARAFLVLMDAPRGDVHCQAINVGANDSNYRVRDVVEEVRRHHPRARVVFTGEVGHDPRNYRVSFDKLGRLLPNFQLEHTLASGVEDLQRKLAERRFSRSDLDDVRFVRLRKLRQVLPRLQSLRVVRKAPHTGTES